MKTHLGQASSLLLIYSELSRTELFQLSYPHLYKCLAMFSDQDTSVLATLQRKNPLSRFTAVSEVIVNRDSHTAMEHHPPQSIRVLSWNIAKNNDCEHWQKEFRQLLEQHQPDKIFLQEVRLCARSAHTDARRAFGLINISPELSWSFAPNLLDQASHTYAGVLTATHTRRLSSQAVTTRHTEPILQTPKATLFAKYALKDCSESLLTVNTHLINFVRLYKFEAQLQAIETVLQAHSGAIILSGDFNTWNSSRSQRLTQMTQRLQLQPVSFNTEDTQKIKSFLRSPPLDHIFYRGFEQKPLTATVIDHLTSSDHNPLIVELYRPAITQ